MEKAKDPASLCLGCMARKDVCPACIDIPCMVFALRARLVEEEGLSWTERMAYRGVPKHLQRKLDGIEATGAEIVVTNCAPCILQLRGGLDRRNSSIRVLHSAELLARYGNGDGGG